VLRCGDGYGRDLDLAVGGEELIDGTEGAAAKVARNCVGAVEVGIYYADQAYRFTLFREFLIDAGVVPPEGADAHYGGIND
jgi:hypothetical protein